jgi:hypothetical protein
LLTPLRYASYRCAHSLYIRSAHYTPHINVLRLCHVVPSLLVATSCSYFLVCTISIRYAHICCALIRCAHSLSCLACSLRSLCVHRSLCRVAHSMLALFISLRCAALIGVSIARELALFVLPVFALVDSLRSWIRALMRNRACVGHELSRAQSCVWHSFMSFAQKISRCSLF